MPFWFPPCLHSLRLAESISGARTLPFQRVDTFFCGLDRGLYKNGFTESVHDAYEVALAKATKPV